MLEAHIQRRGRAGEESDEEFLRRHSDLADVLAPMLHAADGPAATVAGPGSAPTWRGLPGEGEVVGGYRIERLLGQGGMGVVFLATDERLQRRVALKLLRPERLGLGAARDRFLREAKLAARVEHPGICPVYEVGVADDLPFMAMRFLEGETLAAHLARRRQDPTPLDEAEVDALVSIAERAARALHHAHEHGIVHRDVKPANILLEPDGAPVLLDFGMARSDDDFALTMTGELAGTPLYMSPEQVVPSARGVDHRADVYGLGVTLYEAVGGAPPFHGTTMHELLDAIVRREAPGLHETGTHVPRDLDVVIGKAIDKDRDRRYVTAAQFADDLARVLERLPVHARPLGPLVRAQRWTRRNPLPVALLTLAIVALVAITALYFRAENARAGFDLLALVPRLRDLRASERGIYATGTERGERLSVWEHEAEALLAAVPTVRRAHNDLAPRAAHDRAALFLHETLGTLLRDLDELVDPVHGALPRVRRNLAWVGRERKESVDAHADAWASACAAIRTSPKYGGLDLRPQVGLVPLGEARPSGLFEFAHVRSGAPPRRRADGSLEVDAETGIVFVLVPASTFRMGCRKQPGDVDHDAAARPDEAPPHDVALAAFFLAKHELTQGQWMRLGDGDNPSEAQPGAGFRIQLTLAHPVEMVSWRAAVDVLAEADLVLPTEAQWEYACRAGTSSPWWTGDDVASLAGRANVADAAAHRAGARWSDIAKDLDDGFPWHAPVDALAPNGFGFHHITGNVYEWCRDTYGPYRTAPAAGDGLRHDGPGDRVVRGGAFDHGPEHARSAMRRRVDPLAKVNSTGVRAARPVRQ